MQFVDESLVWDHVESFFKVKEHSLYLMAIVKMLLPVIEHRGYYT